MRSWRNDGVLIGGSFLLGAVFVTICFGWWPDTGDANGVPTHPFWRFLWQWQTLITGVIAIGVGVTAWRSVQAQIISAQQDTDRQIGEMRRQFRHEMQVRTTAERNAADRALDRAFTLLGAAVHSIDKIHEANAVPNPERAASYYAAGLVNYAKSLADWIGKLSPPVSNYLDSERYDVLTTFLVRLDLLSVDDDPTDEAHLKDLQADMRRVLELLQEVEREIRSTVPP